MTRVGVERKWSLSAHRRNVDPTMPSSFTISDLRQRPEFFDHVAERIWQAWWKADGHPLDYISTQLRRFRSRWSLMMAHRFSAPLR
jgi:hypothetical protein